MSEAHLDEYQTRLQKLHQLKEAGIVPYANKFAKTHSTIQLLEHAKNYNFPEVEMLMEQGAENSYSTAGRIISFRSHGKLSFAKIRDASGDLQLAFVRDCCKLHTWYDLVDQITIWGETISAYKFVEKYIDVADFLWAKGELFMTKHGEVTLFVNEFQLLSKSLRPLGDKRHGVKDEEKIYRQRYLDMTMNEESYDRFQFKSRFYEAVRQFYVQEGFIEIETSILGNAASGAAARPFTTHHHDYDLDVYLRIAFETSLKMATVGRYEKVFEIGKDFRNEGSDPSHIQEFTQVEHYAVYRNFEDNMRFTEKMFAYLFDHLQLPNQLPIKDKDGESKLVDWSTPRQKIDYIDGVKQASGGIDITSYGMEDADSLRKEIRKKWFEWPGMDEQSTTTLIDYLYKKVLRPSILWPAFVYNYPKLMQPLARQNDQNPSIVEQFQVVVNGREIIKAYSELVDPTLQRANFDEQAEAAAQGDNEATSGDDEFLLAMEHGMPPQSGFGMGFERILTLLTGQDNIRDVVMFPLMKPLQQQEISTGKSKQTKIAVVLLNSSVDLEPRQQMNTIAHLNASFAARRGKELFLQDEITTQDSHQLKLNIQHAILIKQGEGKQLLTLFQEAAEAAIDLVTFTREMLETTDDRKVIEQTAKKKHDELEYLWILLFGEKKQVEALTKGYELYEG